MNLGGHFDIKEKKEKISKLESDLNDPDIWNNHELASNINSKLSSLKKIVENFFSFHNQIEDNIELLNIIDENEIEIFKEINSSIMFWRKKLKI